MSALAEELQPETRLRTRITCPIPPQHKLLNTLMHTHATGGGEREGERPAPGVTSHRSTFLRWNCGNLMVMLTQIMQSKLNKYTIHIKTAKMKVFIEMKLLVRHRYTILRKVEIWYVAQHTDPNSLTS